MSKWIKPLLTDGEALKRARREAKYHRIMRCLEFFTDIISIVVFNIFKWAAMIFLIKWTFASLKVI